MAVPKRRQSKSRSAIRRAQVMKQPIPHFAPCRVVARRGSLTGFVRRAATTKTAWSSRSLRTSRPSPRRVDCLRRNSVP